MTKFKNLSFQKCGSSAFSFSIWTKPWPWLKSRRNISLFTVDLVHYFKHKSDFVLNRDHIHNHLMIHRFKRANDCRNIKTVWNGTTFPQVLLYPVHNVSTQFLAQNTIKVWCQLWTPAQLRPWSGLVVKAPVLRNLIQVI